MIFVSVAPKEWTIDSEAVVILLIACFCIFVCSVFGVCCFVLIKRKDPQTKRHKGVHGPKWVNESPLGEQSGQFYKMPITLTPMYLWKYYYNGQKRPDVEPHLEEKQRREWQSEIDYLNYTDRFKEKAETAQRKIQKEDKTQPEKDKFKKRKTETSDDTFIIAKDVFGI